MRLLIKLDFVRTLLDVSMRCLEQVHHHEVWIKWCPLQIHVQVAAKQLFKYVEN